MNKIKQTTDERKANRFFSCSSAGFLTEPKALFMLTAGLLYFKKET